MKPFNKFQRELGSFYALTIINIIFSGVAMALGVSTSVQNIFIIIESMELIPLQIIITILGFVSFGISLRWLISSIEILDQATDIRNDLLITDCELAE